MLVVCVIALPNIIIAQNTQDTVILLKGIEIVADKIFVKEESGMKETKIDSLVMRAKINMSLADLLSENTSVFIKSYGRGALATASFRGTSASHTQVTWNGLNINSPMTGMVDFSLIPVYIIDDINLKHGTASVADNSGGLGGSINISNAIEYDTGFKIKYLQGIGSYSTYNEFFNISYGNRKIKVRSRLYHNYSKNDYTFINRSIANINPITGKYEYPLDTNDNAFYKTYGLLQEIYYLPNPNNIISAKYWGQKLERTIPRVISYEGAENANLNKQQDLQNKFTIDWTHYTVKSKLLVRTGYTDEYMLYTLHNFVSGLGLIPAIYSESKIKSFINNAKYIYNLNDKLSIEGILNINFYSVWSDDSVKHTGYDVSRKEYSAYLSVNKNFFNRLNLSFKMREDYIDGGFSPFIPYFGFDYKILKNHELILKGNIARNYHQPSLNDLYWQPGGNEDLMPEKGVSMELGLEYQWINDNVKIRSEVTSYRSDINDWIVWIPSFKGYWQPMNIRRVLSQGVETDFSIEQKISDFKYKISCNYAFTSAKNYGDKLIWGDESYGKQLVYIPLHSANAILNVSYKGFYIIYQYNFYSERFTTSSNNVSKRDRLYPYFMNDLFLGKNFKIKRFDISTEFKIYNLLNEDYHSILYRPMPRRNYLLQLVISWE